MSQILARANTLEWEAYRDQERYHPLRDGPRQYAAVWVIETMRKYLPPEQILLAGDLHAKARVLEGTAGANVFERVDCSPKVNEVILRKSTAMIRELAGYEAAAKHRVGQDGRQCFLGVIGGDSQAELARRVRYPEASKRSLRRLVQVTLDALAAYRDENMKAAAR